MTPDQKPQSAATPPKTPASAPHHGGGTRSVRRSGQAPYRARRHDSRVGRHGSNHRSTCKPTQLCWHLFLFGCQLLAWFQ